MIHILLVSLLPIWQFFTQTVPQLSTDTNGMSYDSMVSKIYYFFYQIFFFCFVIHTNVIQVIDLLHTLHTVHWEHSTVFFEIKLTQHTTTTSTKNSVRPHLYTWSIGLITQQNNSFLNVTQHGAPYTVDLQRDEVGWCFQVVTTVHAYYKGR